ncbi:MAG: prepilin peptidase [Gammaproteobacteria bacterium]|nr:prepilin peptidase [Gammaproteobacteria bacterium]
MTLSQALATNPAFLLGSVAILGLVVGSFLNVVIYRLPKMMNITWREQCLDYLENDHSEDTNTDTTTSQARENTTEKYNLMVPRSACPACGHPITALQNIPVISYLALKGRCATCKTPIPSRYPIIEATTAILSVIVAWHFGFTGQCLAALTLTWALIALSVIDIDHKLLPDNITLPFLWLGLLINLNAGLTDSNSSIIGAVAGYLSLWSVYWAFKLLTRKEGMGYGDFKLLAMLGAWMGWQSLPGIVLLSSFVGAAIGIALILFRGRDKNSPIPFGPYLAIAGWIYLLWGDQITQVYFNIAGIQ